LAELTLFRKQFGVVFVGRLSDHQMATGTGFYQKQHLEINRIRRTIVRF
jgi:hypothetical protein